MTAQPQNRFVFCVVVVEFAVNGNQALGMPRKTTGKAGRIDQSRDPFVIKVNREDVKLNETSVLVKSPSHLLLQKSGWEGQNWKRKHSFWGGGGHNYCLNTNSLNWLVRAT